MTNSATHTKRVLTYSSIEDPGKAELLKLQTLSYIDIIDMFPGVALVEILKEDIPKLQKDLPLWDVSVPSQLNP